MSTRLDTVLQKHPEHEEGIRLLASCDPSRNLKYLDWGTKMLVSGQALAPEIADIIELHNQFRGRPIANYPSRKRIEADVYVYRPQDLAKLRDDLLKMKRAQDRKRRERERLYHLDEAIEADVVYESDALIVRHIKNKSASAHYGLGTKWCISMVREGYFEDYETQNATFFFFERKNRLGDEYDKVALMIPRCREGRYVADAFTSLDHRVGMLELAEVYGSIVFDIFRVVYEHSAKHPPSSAFLVHQGKASAEQLEALFAKIDKLPPHETRSTLEAICCNDAAPLALLEEIRLRADAILRSSERRRERESARFMRQHRRNARRRRRTTTSRSTKARVDKLVRDALRGIHAALVIHPNTPVSVLLESSRKLRRAHVDIGSIRRVEGARIEYSTPHGPGSAQRLRRRLRLRRRPRTEKAFLKRAEVCARQAKKYRAMAVKARRKAATKRKRAA
jgi:hypothetical protein